MILLLIDQIELEPFYLFNVMPLGKTNIDPFDRYHYQSVDNVEMINYIEDTNV